MTEQADRKLAWQPCSKLSTTRLVLVSEHEHRKIPKPPNVFPVAGCCCCCCWGCPKMLVVPAAGWLVGCPKAPVEPNAPPAIITCQKVSDGQRQDSYLLTRRHHQSRSQWRAYSAAQRCPQSLAAAVADRNPRSLQVVVVVVAAAAVEAD